MFFNVFGSSQREKWLAMVTFSTILFLLVQGVLQFFFSGLNAGVILANIGLFISMSVLTLSITFFIRLNLRKAFEMTEVAQRSA
jgi:hypothetical protein